MHTEKKELGFPRPYLRDGVPGLPIERQREILHAAGVDISDERMLFVDRLTDAAIKRRDPAALKQRAAALTPLHQGETIYVAGLRVLGWTMSDIARALLSAAKHRANVRCVDTDTTFSADMPGAELLEALAGAEEAHRRGTAQDKQHRAITAARAAKNRRTAQKVERAKPLWGDRRYTVDEIAVHVGLSRRTLYNVLGPRWEDVQHA